MSGPMTGYFYQHRNQYCLNGFDPIPIEPGKKHPNQKGWQARNYLLDSELMERPRPYDGIGIRTAQMPAIDIDITDIAVEEAIRAKVAEMLPGGQRLLRIGMAPRSLIPCRLDGDRFKKIVTGEYTNGMRDAGGELIKHKVEILADGQQYVSEHIHPDTGRPYSWEGNITPASVLLSDLPPLSMELAQKIANACDHIMAATNGWDAVTKPVKGRRAIDAPKLPNNPEWLAEPDAYLEYLQQSGAVLNEVEPGKYNGNCLFAHRHSNGKPDGAVFYRRGHQGQERSTCVCSHNGCTGNLMNDIQEDAASNNIDLPARMNGTARPGDWFMKSGTSPQSVAAAAESPLVLPNDAGVKGMFMDTDTANADRFAKAAAGRLLYTVEAGWHAWDGKCWQKEGSDRLVQELAKLTARNILKELVNMPADDERDRVYKWAKRSEARERINAMVMLSKSDQMMYAELRDFDTNPMLFNCNNGIVNLSSGEFQTHDPRQLMTMISPVDYDQHAQCPLWLRFLGRIMEGDAEMISYIQRVIGYCLTGETSEQCLFFLFGQGRNGKSVLSEVLLALMGTYGITTAADTIMVKKYGGGIPNDVARLAGRRMVTVSEIELGQEMAESLVKTITGGDTITARFLNKEFFDFKPEFKPILRGNHKPIIKGTDLGIWRRIQMLMFPVAIPEEEQDKRLEKKLEKEMSGILNWAIQGAVSWGQHGLMPPEKVSAAVAMYRGEMDTLAEFIDQYCVVGKSLQIGSTDLFKYYKHWCDENGEKAETNKTFGITLSARDGVTKFREASGRVAYFGIDLKPEMKSGVGSNQ